jgi:hypothetical protein
MLLWLVQAIQRIAPQVQAAAQAGLPQNDTNLNMFGKARLSVVMAMARLSFRAWCLEQHVKAELERKKKEGKKK